MAGYRAWHDMDVIGACMIQKAYICIQTYALVGLNMQAFAPRSLLDIPDDRSNFKLPER